MRGGVCSAPVFVVALLVFSAGCGGGGGTGGVQPPPPQPDFTIGLSTASVDVPQGGTSSPVNVSISPLNGFSGSVQVSFTSLPSGVTTNPASPLSVSAGQSVPVLFGAAASVPVGQSNVTAQATSGSLSHSQTLTLAIQSVTQANLPRTGYVENDSVTSVDTPPGEPRRRQIVSDPANQRFYVANGAMNRVEVFSAASPSLQTTIDAPGASSMDPAGGTTLSLSGANFSSNPQMRFGALNPISATASSTSQLQGVSPASTASGPVNLTAYFANGWLSLAPGAFSYGPKIVRVLPNAGSASGGDTVTVFGYGFGGSSGGVTATLGGQAATIVSVDALPVVTAALGLDSTLERIVLKTPGGSAGKVDLAITSSAGSVTLAKAFQYVASSQTYSNPGLHKFVVYDESRQQLYLSATDHVDVLNLNTQVFATAIEPPPNGPHHTQLVVADFGAQSVYLINPDGAANNGTAVTVGGVAGFLNSGPARVTATSAQTVFVGLSGEGSSTGSCNNCLGQMNLLASPPSFEPAPQPEVSTLTGAPLLQADAGGDTAFLAYDTSPGGPVAVWSAATPDAFSVSTANDMATDLTTCCDGTLFALRANNTAEIRGSDLALFSTPAAPEVEAVPNRVAVPGMVMHPSGALLYDPFLDGPPPAAPPATGIHGGIDIRDAHNGQLRLRVYLPEPFAMLNTDLDGLHGGFLATDENGQRLFAVTTTGLTIVQLANVPLGIGTLSPATGASVGGVSVTVRGSGFQNGTKATLGGNSATVTLKDMNTLTLSTPSTSAGPQQLVLTNPDGETVSLDAAYLAQ